MRQIFPVKHHHGNLLSQCCLWSRPLTSKPLTRPFLDFRAWGVVVEISVNVVPNVGLVLQYHTPHTTNCRFYNIWCGRWDLLSCRWVYIQLHSPLLHLGVIFFSFLRQQRFQDFTMIPKLSKILFWRRFQNCFTFVGFYDPYEPILKFCQGGFQDRYKSFLKSSC